MKLAVVLNIHNDPALVMDTVDSIIKWATKDILVVVDGAAKERLADLSLPTYRVDGFYHNFGKSPYRNVALGLKSAWDLWHNNVDWYCYTEPDCLFGSDEFKSYLEAAGKANCWCVGNDYRKHDSFKLSIIERMLGRNFDDVYYLLGCCVFYKSEFIENLANIDFFNKLLYWTNGLDKGFFPEYKGYDVSEHLYPTLAKHFGGGIFPLATWYAENQQWGGEYEKFPFRWKPDIGEEEDFYKAASIMHPVKDVMSPIRVYHRKKREDELPTTLKGRGFLAH